MSDLELLICELETKKYNLAITKEEKQKLEYLKNKIKEENKNENTAFKVKNWRRNNTVC